MIKKESLIMVIALIFFMAGCRATDISSLDKVRPKKMIDYATAIRQGRFSLADDASLISIRVIQDKVIPVMGSFNLVNGGLNINKGQKAFTLKVDLFTWDSGLVERDLNVIQTVFRAPLPKYQMATFEIDAFDDPLLQSFKKDKKLNGVTVTGRLKYLDREIPVEAKLNVTINAAAHVIVESVAPITLKISDLGLGDLVQTLISTFNQKPIEDMVEIGVYLEFEPE